MPFGFLPESAFGFAGILNYVIRQLTQSSTWIGIAIIVTDLILPRTCIMFLGILLLINDDARLQTFLGRLKTDIEGWWK